MITRRQIAELKQLALEEGDRRREAALGEKDMTLMAVVECCMNCQPGKAFYFLKSVFKQKRGGPATCYGCGYIVSLVRNDDPRFKGIEDLDPGGYTILCEQPLNS